MSSPIRSFSRGKCDTSFIDKHPELMKMREKKDRATKVLNFIGDVIVNGSPGISQAAQIGRADGGRVPEIDYTSRAAPYGTRDHVHEAEGAEGLGKWILEQKRLLLTDTTMRDAHQSLPGHPGPDL